MSIRKHVAVLLSFVFALTVYAQGKFQVTGNVSDSDGEPLAGVTISVKEQPTLAVATDIDGNYKIAVPSKNSTLTFSYIGMAPISEKVNGRKEINIVMTSVLTELDEVVAVGYGSMSKDMLTTSISKVDSKVLENVPYTNLTQAIQGSVSGVRVQSTSGQPGEASRIVIRGGTSIQSPDGAQPLYVVDGVTREDINHLSANDIESIQVLKDAASTSIYGAKGSNGVVIITTKTAKEGKATVNYTYDFSVATTGRRYKFASTEDYLTLQRTGAILQDKFPDVSNELSLATGFGTGNDLSKNTVYTTQYLTDANKHKLQEGWKSMADPIDPTKTLIYQSNNTADLPFRTAYSHNHHAEVSGRSDRASFLVGIGYSTNEGTLKATDYNRLSFNVNGDVKVLSNLSVNAKVYYSNTRTHTTAFNQDVAFYRMASLAPTAKIYYEDGSLAPGPQWGMSNPLYSMSIAKNVDKSENYTFSLGGDWTILPGLSFKPQISLYKTTEIADRFMPAYYNGPINQDRTRNASTHWGNMSHYQADAVLNYIKTFKEDHNLNVMLGLDYTERIFDDVWAGGRGGATDNITTVNGVAEKTTASSSSSSHKMMGYFGRVNYNYKNKYLLGITARYDGASNLGKNNRYGFFPGVSAGWRVDQESFYPEDLKRNLQAKIRASYGVNGNINGLADWTAVGYYSTGATHFGNAAVRLGFPANDDVQWERSKTLDIGADFKLLNNRIDLTVDWFRRKTDNLITMYALPPSTGLGSVYTNLGSLENKGIELELNAELLRFDKDGIWRFGINASKVTNKILELPDNGVENNRIGGDYVWDSKTQTYAWKGGLQEGGTMGDMYGYKMIGVYKTDEEAANAPIDMIVSVEDKTKFGGDAIWDDVDGNGIIDERDRVYLGNQYPDWTGGFNTSLSWKGFDFYARFDYTIGHTVYNWAKMFIDYSLFGPNNTSEDIVKYSWKQQGDDAKYPRYYQGNYYQHNVTGARNSSLYYESGDFLCVRELTLSYSFLPEIFKKARLSNVRLSVTGSNLFYFTKYKGLNPEDGGTDNGRYALPRNVTCSIGVTF